MYLAPSSASHATLTKSCEKENCELVELSICTFWQLALGLRAEALATIISSSLNDMQVLEGICNATGVPLHCCLSHDCNTKLASWLGPNA